MNKKFGEELIDLIFGTISVFKKVGLGKILERLQG